jgi:hypothetical protein
MKTRKTRKYTSRPTVKNDAKIEMAFKILRTQLPLYRKVKDNADELELFAKMNRNPLFDTTQNLNMYKTRWVSQAAMVSEPSECVYDHFVQRSKAVKKIYEAMDRNPNMKVGGFRTLLKKYCQQVRITKEEHNRLTVETRGSEDYNFTLYDKCGITFDYDITRGRKKNFHYEMFKNYGHLLAE